MHYIGTINNKYSVYKISELANSISKIIFLQEVHLELSLHEISFSLFPKLQILLNDFKE